MRIISFTLILILSTFIAHTFAQQIAKNNLYHINPNYINPAATGTRECAIFNVTDKHQWLGIQGAPSIQVFSIQTPKQFSKYKKHGLGANITRDVNGAIQNLEGEFIYSYHIKFGRINDNFLSLGLAANINQYSLSEKDFTEGLYDPIVTGATEQEISYNASSGIYVYSNMYFTGIGVYNLLPVNSTYYRGYGNERFFITAIAGKTFTTRNKKYEIISSVYGAKGDNFLQIDINNKIDFKNNIWAGLTFRKYIGEFHKSGQNALIFLGYNREKCSFTYMLDLGINSLQRRHFGSHLFSLEYRICRSKYACPTYEK